MPALTGLTDEGVAHSLKLTTVGAPGRYWVVTLTGEGLQTEPVLLRMKGEGA